VRLTHVPLEHLGYEEAYAIQQAHHEAVLDRRKTEKAELGRVMMVEHPALITVTRRPDAPGHVLHSEVELLKRGVELHQTDRGGDVTYHGPGQLVCYPIVDLNAAKMRIHDYIRALEGAVIETLAGYGIVAHTDSCATGVWVLPADNPGYVFASDEAAKICAIGVRVRKWITLHGLALNLDPDMGHYELLVPCGLAGRPVISMRAILGEEKCPTIGELSGRLFGCLEEKLGSGKLGSI